MEAGDEVSADLSAPAPTMEADELAELFAVFDCGSTGEMTAEDLRRVMTRQ